VRRLGKYRLIEPLASGGMADVWRAEVTGAEGVVKEVALKLVRGGHAPGGDFVRMFIQEARLASRLSHANVVQVFEFDQVDGCHYIAMELVRGRHLGKVVERARELGVRLGLARAVHAGAEVARGLAYAHRLADRGRPLGLVHRDVSPHNVLVSFEGEVKLADFGIARAMSQAGLTAPGTLKGKLAYMAPEQARGATVDARADVFSLGVVLWELCAGRRLFARDVEAATLAALLDPAPPSPPSAWNEAVPPELDAVILAALEKDAARRTASAQELATALASVLLRLARSPEDFDLRAFMHRLWPDEAAAAPGPTLETTRVRVDADSGSAPPEAAPGPGAASAPGAPPAEPAEAAPEPEPEPTAATRTAAPAGGEGTLGRRRAALALAGIAVLAAVAVAGARAVRPRAGSAGLPPAVAADHGRAAAAPVAPPALGAPGAADQAPTAVAAAAPPSAPPPAPGAPEPATPAAAARIASSAGALLDARPGTLHVTASPWALITIDGHVAGETPVTRALPPGRHRIRATHPRYGDREATVEIAAARRTTWHANLAR
jgi:serine/threonine-protein kinase